MFFPAPDSRLQLGFAGPEDDVPPHLSVDGMTPVGPNLSHWPGNRTPPHWRADLSTGIALRFARANAVEQQDFLGDVEWVLNDHYDTDGFGSLLAVLRPEIAFAREEVLLAAAGTGDFGLWHTWRGFAIDRIVAGLASAQSPVRGAFANIDNPSQLALRRYAWLLDHATAVLDQPGQFAPLYADEMAIVQNEIQRGLAGAVQRRAFAELGLAVVSSDGPRRRLTLNTLAGAFRVLHVQQDRDGTRYRFHDRTESWFHMVTVQTPPRRDLRRLAAQLRTLEPAQDGASWHADAPDAPIPELYFGVPSDQEYGQITRELRPSRLPVEQVTGAFVEFFAAAK